MRSKALLFTAFFCLQILQVKPCFAEIDYSPYFEDLISRLNFVLGDTGDINDLTERVRDLLNRIDYELTNAGSSTYDTIRSRLRNLDVIAQEDNITLSYILENLTEDDSWMWTCLAGILEDYAYTYNEPEWATLEVFEAVTNFWWNNLFWGRSTDPKQSNAYLLPSYLWRNQTGGYTPDDIGSYLYALLAGSMNSYPLVFSGRSFLSVNGSVAPSSSSLAQNFNQVIQGMIPNRTISGQSANAIFPSELDHYRWLYTVSNTAPYVSLLPKYANSAGTFEFDNFGDYTLEHDRLERGTTPVSGARSIRPSYNYFTDWLADFQKYQFAKLYGALSGATNALNGLLAAIDQNVGVPENPNQGTQPELAPDSDDFEDPSLTALENTSLDGSAIVSDFSSLGSDLLTAADLPGNDSSRLQVIPAFPRAHYWGWTWLDRPQYIELDDYVPTSTIRGVMHVVWNIVGALGLWLIARKAITDVVKGS